MPRDVYVLSRELMEAVRRAEEAVRQARQNTENRQVVEDPPTQAPEVYIALTPTGGIPALTVLPGTGTGGYDQPGVAECDIYQARFIAGSPLNPEIVPVTGITRLVYNLSTTAIAGDTWILLVRDKYGSWIADPIDPSGGSTGHPVTVLFDHLDDVFTVGSTEEDLYSYTVAAGTLAADGYAIKAEYCLTYDVTVGFDTRIRAYFAGTLIADTDVLVDQPLNTNDALSLDILIVRNEFNAVKVVAKILLGGVPVQPYVFYNEITSLDLTGTSYILKVTGEDTLGGGQIGAHFGKGLLIQAAP